MQLEELQQQSETQTRRPRLVANQPPIRLHQKPRLNKLIKINTLCHHENVEPTNDQPVKRINPLLPCRHRTPREYRAVQYVTKRRNLDQIAEDLEISATTVFRAVKQHELQRGRRRGPHALSDPAWVYGRYINNGATSTDIANELGVPTSLVRQALRRHAITRN